MREFTNQEKELVKKLIKHHSNGNSIKLGELLLKIFPIEYMIPTKNRDEPFYKDSIYICFDDKKVSSDEIYEAINILLLLIKLDYLVVKEFYSADCIGEKHYGLYGRSDDTHIVERHLFNYHNCNLWELLNSHYYVTNSLIDFAKDFQTIGNRQHKKELAAALESAKWSQIAAIAAIFSLLISVIFGICQMHSSQKIDSDQINAIENAIKYNHIEEPLEVEIKNDIPLKTIEVKKQNNTSSTKITNRNSKQCTDSQKQQK